MNTCESEVTDFGAYIEVAQSFKKSKNVDIVSSQSIRSVQKQKDLFDPYPWIPNRSKLIQHPLDPYSTNADTSCDTKCYLLRNDCKMRIHTVDAMCEETPSFTTSLSVLVCLLVFVIIVFSSYSND